MKFKGDELKVKNRTVEDNFQLHAHNGSGFDTWIKINNLPCDEHIVDIFKNGKGIISMKILKGYIQNGRKQTPQNPNFRCGMTHLNYFLKNLRKTFKLQKELLKTETNHDEITRDNSRDKKDEWVDYVEIDFLCTAFSNARFTKAMEDTGFGVKDCFSLPGLQWKCLNSLRTEVYQPVYTYNDKHMRWFV